MRTSDARQILRKQVLLKDAIRQWGNIAGLVAGFMGHDYDLIGRSLEDVIIEPVRSMLIPGFDEVKQRCKEAGALGGGISGSGPSIFMLSRDESTARQVEDIMKDIYHQDRSRPPYLCNHHQPARSKNHRLIAAGHRLTSPAAIHHPIAHVCYIIVSTPPPPA